MASEMPEIFLLVYLTKKIGNEIDSKINTKAIISKIQFNKPKAIKENITFVSVPHAEKNSS